MRLMAVNAAVRSARKIGAMDMLAMQITAPRTLEAREVEVPQPGPGEVLVEVAACGVCRTDLHIFDGDIGAPRLPLTPGHQVVGHVKKRGPGAFRFREGARVGIPWLGLACGRCDHCLSGRENLCDHPRFTGLHRDGGFARFAVADERFCLKLPDALDDVHAAPLLCAGLIGHRAYVMTGGARRLGIYGFGGAGHLVAQIAVREGREVYGFTKPGDERAQAFARSLGCRWAGASDAAPPVTLDAAIVFAPAGEVVPRALAAVGKGGTVICAGIHMSDIPSFPYKLLWGERVLRSVANLTRRDGEAFLKVAAEANLRTVVREYALEDASAALDDLRNGRFEGAAVLVPGKAARS